MEDRIFENNKVTISGEIVSDFTFSHEVFDEGFYEAFLSVKRDSGTADIIPITVSERLMDVKADWKGHIVEIRGQFRSYNKHEERKNRLILSVFAREILFWEDDGEPVPSDINSIYLDGFICKDSHYRKTPFGREITDILLAVNRPYGKADYIPCICWGRNARFCDGIEVGTHIIVEGRIQSREYQKRISDEEYETRVAYEVSASRITVIEE